VMTAGVAPASASCGGLLGGAVFGGGCSPCASPCGGYGASYAYGASYGYGGGYIATGYQQLPDPAQYYYVNQGPVYGGPANFAPSPYYQESIPTAYYGGYGYGGGYYGGGAGWRGGGYGYRNRSAFRGGFYGASRSGYRYGGAARYGYGHRHGGYAQRHSFHGGRHMGGHHMGGRMGGHGHGGHMMHRR